MSHKESEDVPLDLAAELGANPGASHQILTLYIPNKDRHDTEFGAQRKWVLEAATLLARIGGGVTIMPPTEGGWFDEPNDRIIWENPVVVCTYIRSQSFLENLGPLREFLHRMGRETDQGEVAVEFDGQFYRITSYDSAVGGQS
jgi:hypothetical protein